MRLIAPNFPELAVAYAVCASRLMHDSEGIHGERFFAALASQASSKRDAIALIEMGWRVIPSRSEYALVIRSVLKIDGDERLDISAWILGNGRGRVSRRRRDY